MLTGRVRWARDSYREGTMNKQRETGGFGKKEERNAPPESRLDKSHQKEVQSPLLGKPRAASNMPATTDPSESLGIIEKGTPGNPYLGGGQKVYAK